ncbi:MAG: FHA domain-containing protein [Faecousia sp.]
MDLGEYIFMKVAIVVFFVLIAAALQFLLRLIRKGLSALRNRNSAPKQAAPVSPQPAPQPAAPATKKEETVILTPPDRTPSGAVSPKGTIPLEPQQDPYPAVKPGRYSSHQLRALSGEHKGKTFPLYEMQEFTIGRNPQCQICFRPDTPGVSGFHCKIEVIDHSGIGTWSSEVKLTDLNSTYGTYLGNGTRLTPNREYPLQVGDTFLLANGGPAFLLEKNRTPFVPENDSREDAYPHTAW